MKKAFALIFVFVFLLTLCSCRGTVVETSTLSYFDGDEVPEGNHDVAGQSNNDSTLDNSSPGDSAGNMNKTFEAAMKAIEQIETTMKKSKKVKK